MCAKVSGRLGMSKPNDDGGNEKKTARRQAVRRGRWAELLVRLYLTLRAHKILAANYKTPVGEIDLIARRNGRISFIEVKARAQTVDAAEALGARQRARIQRAAEYFLTQHPALQVCDIRFDVALVTGPLKLEYLADAWRP